MVTKPAPVVMPLVRWIRGSIFAVMLAPTTNTAGPEYIGRTIGASVGMPLAANGFFLEASHPF